MSREKFIRVMSREKFIREMSGAIRDGIELKRTDDIGMAHLYQDRMEKCFNAAFDALAGIVDADDASLEDTAEEVRRDLTEKQRKAMREVEVAVLSAEYGADIAKARAEALQKGIGALGGALGVSPRLVESIKEKVLREREESEAAESKLRSEIVAEEIMVRIKELESAGHPEMDLPRDLSKQIQGQIGELKWVLERLLANPSSQSHLRT